jgi:iron complex transport system substrate-binding protein
MIGEVYRTPRAAELIASMKNRVATIEDRVKGAPRPTVFVQLDGSLYTIGRGSYLTDLISRAGGVSATDQLENAYLQLSKEAALALDPEIIILSDSPDNSRPSDTFRNSRATRDSRVFRINADIMSRPGPRVAEALEKIAGVIHPELFKQ